MTLRTYLSARELKKNRENNEFYDGDVKAAFLNNVAIPSPTLICQHQKEIFKLERGVYSLKTNDVLLKSLNNDMEYQAGSFIGNNFFEDSIAEIENFVRTLDGKDYDNIVEKISKLQTKESDLNSLINDFKITYTKLAEYKDLKSVSFALEKLNARLQGLENFIFGELSSNISIPKIQDSFNKRIFWCEYAIKGTLLEAKGKEFFMERLPNNFKVLSTGKLFGYYDIMGNYKNSGAMKEDLMIFDNDKFKIEFTIGKNNKKYSLTLKNFMEFLDSREGTDTIRITQTGYEEMQKHLIAGVQAKATSSNRLKFGNVNINTANLETEGRALLALKEIYQKTPILQRVHEDYNALFNYNLARNINHILGHNNSLLLTRNGLTDMYNYILDLFEKGKYFYTTEEISLKSNAGNKVAIDFVLP